MNRAAASAIVQIFKQMYCISCGDVRLSTAIFSAVFSSISILSFANPILAISFKSFTSQTSILIRLSLPERSAPFFQKAHNENHL